MQLSDLFVSHKQVKPVSFTIKTPSSPQPVYLNRERAQAIISETKPEEDSSTWKAEEPLNWKVANSDVVVIPQEPGSSDVTVESGTNPSVKSWINPYKGNKNKWILDMTVAYKKAGLNDNAIKNLLAKNALESGYGTYAQGDFNFGNITTGSNWSGRYVQGRDSNANGQVIKQRFRAYDSLYDAVNDEIKFLSSLYDFNQDDDFDTFVGKLQGDNRGGRKYAEATSYKEALRGVYNSIYGKS